MEFNPGFDIIPTVNPMGFKYGADVFGPQVENRYLRDIRGSLSDPQCDGPEIVYSIAMTWGNVNTEKCSNGCICFMGS